MNNLRSYRILELPPKPPGFVEVFPGYMIAAKRKPSRFHLFMMKLFFGWKWVPYK